MGTRLSRYFDGWIADILRQTTPEGLREAMFEGAMRRRAMSPSPGFVDLQIGHFTFVSLRLARRSVDERSAKEKRTAKKTAGLVSNG
jgi:hypothetical protein